ncbi:hypothetical protein BB560_002274 [Smittium megazygosporum]|uniref:K Homology domain-containing protein n=1 Tax=Smittium megazygosporum TaxID=133381 RepID=A0A2T9ZFA9_9FUNG|nr:hypothetical protein BB560_002274 [Smittium megazygosporum]
MSDEKYNAVPPPPSLAPSGAPINLSDVLAKAKARAAELGVRGVNDSPDHPPPASSKRSYDDSEDSRSRDDFERDYKRHNPGFSRESSHGPSYGNSSFQQSPNSDQNRYGQSQPPSAHNDHHSGYNPPPMYGSSASDSNQSTPQLITETMDIPANIVGYLIGKGGETIKLMQSQSNCRIYFNQELNPTNNTKTLILSGSAQTLAVAKNSRPGYPNMGYSGRGGYSGSMHNQYPPQQYQGYPQPQQGYSGGAYPNRPSYSGSQNYSQQSGYGNYGSSGYPPQGSYPPQNSSQPLDSSNRTTSSGTANAQPSDPQQNPQSNEAAWAAYYAQMGYPGYSNYAAPQQPSAGVSTPQQSSSDQVPTAESSQQAATTGEATASSQSSQIQWTNSQYASYYAQYAASYPEYAQYAEYYKQLAAADPNGYPPNATTATTSNTSATGEYGNKTSENTVNTENTSTEAPEPTKSEKENSLSDKSAESNIKDEVPETCDKESKNTEETSNDDKDSDNSENAKSVKEKTKDEDQKDSENSPESEN